ncbi:MAG: RNA polymerase sigma factor [Planctomyces sp.]|jgi:RNA polymerase sigma-70 factor (ECF subfamily)
MMDGDFQVQVQHCAQRLSQSPEAALAELFDLTAERLVRYAMSVTSSQADAEDALQGAFSRIARRPQLLVAAKLPWSYLLRTVRNEALRILQRNSSQKRLQVPASTVQATPEQQLLQQESSESVRRILKSLPSEQSEVVTLKHWEDLTFAEIAEVLGISQNTVASRYRYAMEKLQRALEGLVR